METQKKIIGATVLLACICALVWAWQTREEQQVSPVPVQAELDESFRDLKIEIGKRFAEAADMLNAEVPRNLSEGVTLRHVEAEDGPSMTYHYVLVGAEAPDGDPVLAQVCSTPEMRDYMQYGVFYTYRYEDAQGKELLVLRIDEDACKASDLKRAKEQAGAAAPVPIEPAVLQPENQAVEQMTDQPGGQAAESAAEQAVEPAAEQAAEQAAEPAGEQAAQPAGDQAAQQE